MRGPVVVAMHARSGLVGLNVVTAALDADARTCGLDVHFVKDTAQMAAAIDGAAASGRTALALWSFYSPDLDASASDLAEVRSRTAGRALHVVGGVHATAEPQATLEAGFD